MGVAGTQPQGLDGRGLRIAIAMSRFNRPVVQAMCASAQTALTQAGVDPTHIEVVQVAGALELPLTLQWLAQTRRFDALIALGCVIRGETYHFEVVSNEASRGITDVQLQTGVPIANAVLTVENDTQALARVDKGAEAAHVAIEMARLRKQLSTTW